MDKMSTPWSSRLLRLIKWALWILVAILLIQQACAPYQLDTARADLIDRFQQDASRASSP